MGEFYVSAQGDDRDDGRTPLSPWRTLEKVNGFTFQPGDRLRFRCGDTFHGPLNIRTNRMAGGPACTVEPYGGDIRNMPKLSCYKIIKPEAWTEVGGGIWRAEINNPTQVAGNVITTGADGANIGFLNVDGKLYANKSPSPSALRRDWDFHSDGAAFLYVKSTQNPGQRASSFMAAPRVVAVGDSPSMRYRYLEITGAGGHGVRWAGRSDIDMRFCHVHEIGGSYHAGQTRYGNGAEIWVGCSDISVSDCLFGDIYDTATTTQGFPVQTPGAGWNRISLNDNFAYRCAQAFEVWARYGATPGEGQCPEGSGFHDVSALRWRLFDIGHGDFADTRKSRNEVAPFLIYRTETPDNDIRVSVSQMQNCGDRLIANLGVGRLPRQYRLENSNITLRANQPLMTESNQTARQGKAWLNANGFSPDTKVAIDDRPKMTPQSEVVAQWVAHASGMAAAAAAIARPTRFGR
jgi:hypothetical protein